MAQFPIFHVALLFLSSSLVIAGPCPETPNDPGCCLQHTSVQLENGTTAMIPLTYDPITNQCSWPKQAGPQRVVLTVDQPESPLSALNTTFSNTTVESIVRILNGTVVPFFPNLSNITVPNLNNGSTPTTQDTLMPTAEATDTLTMTPTTPVGDAPVATYTLAPSDTLSPVATITIHAGRYRIIAQKNQSSEQAAEEQTNDPSNASSLEKRWAWMLVVALSVLCI